MKLQVQLDRRLVPTDQPVERYLRVQLVAPERSGPGKRLPINLALVIDRSGSMAGTKLEKAKEATIFCLRNLTSADRAAIIAYDDEVRVVSPSRALTPGMKNQLISEVRTIRSGGSTNLGGGWLTGAQQVADHMHEANYLNRVILLSDGLANVGMTDPNELAQHAEELRVRGVSTSTIGIGADFNEDLMERLAIKGGGQFYFIEHASQIPDFLHHELGEVLSTCARNLMLEFILPTGVQAELLNNYEIDTASGSMRVRLDDMISGEVRSVMFKLTVPELAVGVTLPCKLNLAYTDVDSGETRTVTSTEAILTTTPIEEATAEQADKSVLEEVALLQAARAREQALLYDAHGQYAASSNVLASTADTLNQFAALYSLRSEALRSEIKTLKAESQQARMGLSAMDRKTMHYSRYQRQRGRKENEKETK